MSKKSTKFLICKNCYTINYRSCFIITLIIYLTGLWGRSWSMSKVKVPGLVVHGGQSVSDKVTCSGELKIIPRSRKWFLPLQMQAGLWWKPRKEWRHLGDDDFFFWGEHERKERTSKLNIRGKKWCLGQFHPKWPGGWCGWPLWGEL